MKNRKPRNYEGIEAVSATLLRQGVDHIVVTPESVSYAGVAVAGIFRGDSAAEVRRVKDNKLVTVIEESYPISVRDYIKKVCNITNSLAELKSEECYVYWNHVRYRAGKDELETDKNFALKHRRGAYAAEVTSAEAIKDLSKWKHVRSGSAEWYELPTSTYSYRIEQYSADDDSDPQWIVVRKGAGANKSKTAVVPTSDVLTKSGWAQYTRNRNSAVPASTPEAAFKLLRNSVHESRAATAGAEIPTFKIDCKAKILEGADYGIIRAYQGSALRWQSGFEDVTTRKLVNAMTRSLKAGRFDMVQQPGYTIKLNVTKYGKHDSSQGPVSVFNLGAGNDKVENYTVELLNSNKQPVYGPEDVTAKLELVLTPITK